MTSHEKLDFLSIYRYQKRPAGELTDAERTGENVIDGPYVKPDPKFIDASPTIPTIKVNADINPTESD